MQTELKHKISNCLGVGGGVRAQGNTLVPSLKSLRDSVETSEPHRKDRKSEDHTGALTRTGIKRGKYY